MSKSKASALNPVGAGKHIPANKSGSVVEIKKAEIKKTEIKKAGLETSIASHMKEVIRLLGEDTEREGLLRTPERMEKAMQYLTSGYSVSPEEVVNGALFGVNYDEVVIVRDIEFFSMCEHHMLPFFGKMHVAYLPNNKVIGLSKIPRLVDVFARRLQIQERLTQQVAEVIQQLIEPRGVAVVCEARHFCMMMRGVEKQHSGAVTSAMLGAFRDNK
jgi:GTP cyclohydrolase I